MMQVKLKHFDEGQSWTEKRNSPAAAAAGAAGASAPGGGNSGMPKSFSVCTVDAANASSSAADAEALGRILSGSSPSFVFIHNCNAATRRQLMQLSSVRKFYGITDNIRYEPREPTERGTVTLVRIGMTCESVENVTKELEISNNTNGESEGSTSHSSVASAVKLFMTLQVRSFPGASVTVGMLYMDPGAQPWVRTAALSSIIPLLGSAEVIVICANLLTSTTTLNEEICAACNSYGFADATEDAVEKPVSPGSSASHRDWGLWVKSSKLCVTSCAPSFHEGERCVFTSLMAVVGPRSPAGIAIPQPRSAKSANPRGSPWSPAAPPVITDPAILSAEAGSRTGSVQAIKGGGSAIIERLLQQQQQQQQQFTTRWRASSTCPIKNNDKLTREEQAFDVSSHFTSIQEAVDALNSKTIHWPADFCVVCDTILFSDAVGQGDKRTAFRRYAKEYKNSSTLLAQMIVASGAANNPTTNATAEKSAWLKRALATQNHKSADREEKAGSVSTGPAVKREEEHRVRVWDAAWCTVVYQVTPREMKFNVTHLVGLGKDNLAEAIQFLNARALPKGGKAANGRENPLQNYPYDYALLFSWELQGFWLIAATDVPCDIVACRAAA